MFRVLATRLAHLQNKRRLHKLLITSSAVDEGKSVVTANLALTLARRSGERILLMEADLRRPTVSDALLLYAAERDYGMGRSKLTLERFALSVSRTFQCGFWPPDSHG